MRGRTVISDLQPGGDEMGEVIAPSEPSLATRVIAAHRTYILALLACEKAVHEVDCPICGPTAGSRDERLIRALKSATDKEACRVVFRDLLNELGSLPEGLTIPLPDSEDWSCRARALPH